MVVQRISILDRYFLGQFFWPFSLAIGAFGIVGIVDIVFYLIELSVISGISASVVFQLILYKLPAILVLFAPIAVLFSIMLLLVRLIKDHELLVLLSSGISTYRIVAPLVGLGLMASALAYGANEVVVPWTNHHANDLISREIERKPPPEIAEDVVFKGTEDRFFYVQQVNRKTGEMKTVLVFEDTGQFPKILVANRAQWGLNQWQLWDGKTIELNSDADIDYVNTFKKMTIHVNQDLGLLDSNSKSPTEMDSKELRSRIALLEKSGISTQSLKVEYGLKQSIPAACFVFGIIGIGYCLILIKTGKDWWGVVLAIGVAAVTVMLYFFVLAVCRALGKGGGLSPFISVWGANLLFGTWGIGLLMYHTKHR